MCTVTLTPFPNNSLGFILTSNRDEAVERKTIPPQVREEEGTQMLFPKDEQAGGTWIGASGQKRAVCLLNGGFEKHVRKESYRMSRGLIVIDFLAAMDIEELRTCNLIDIEPFTCIIVEWKESLQFFELVWDGENKHFRSLPLEPYIWASTFLFSSESRLHRARSFKSFQGKQDLTPEGLLRFHSSEEGEKESLVIDEGFLKTCSITQIVKTSEGVKMLYKDLLKPWKPIAITEATF